MPQVKITLDHLTHAALARAAKAKKLAISTYAADALGQHLGRKVIRKPPGIGGLPPSVRAQLAAQARAARAEKRGAED